MRTLALVGALFALGVAGLPIRTENATVPPRTRTVDAVQAPDPMVAFPGAYGTGKFAMNRCTQNALANPGRVHILKITNLDGDGNTVTPPVGSWYWALDSVRALPVGDLKFIVADTSGLVQLTGVRDDEELDCTWIAGQTAPGGGITFWSGSGARTRFEGGSNDVVLEYVRTRNAGPSMFGLLRGEISDSTGPVIVNHVSMCYARHTGSGGGQMILNASEYGHDVTFMNSLLCSPDVTHPTITYCNGSHWAQVMVDCTIARNFISGEEPAYRCPLIGGTDRAFVVSNVIHGCTRSIRTSNGGTVDFVANFTIPRPGTPTLDAKWVFEDGCNDDELGLVGPDSHLDCPRSYYIDRNRTEQNGFVATTPADSMYIGSKQSITADDSNQFPFPGVTFRGDTVPQGTWPTGWTRDTAMVEPRVYPVPDMDDAFRDDSVVALAGVSRLLACDGTWRTASPGGSWTAVRDSLDQQHVTFFQNALASTPPFIPNTAWDQNAGVVIPIPPASPKCADTDGDALPDAWEKRHAGATDSTSVEPKVDADGDGFLTFIEYLHNTSPFVFTSFDGTEVAGFEVGFWLRRDSLHHFTATADSACQAYPVDSIANPVAVWRDTDCVPSNDVILKTWGDSLTAGIGSGVYLLPLTDAQLDSICGAWTTSAADSIASCAVIRSWRAPGQPVGD